jgi:hypothetical protein
MLLRLWRRKRALKLLDADAKVRRAENDHQAAQQARREAQELADWARKENLANRFDLRLANAYRLPRQHSL